jgi:hypothetical protein
MQQLLFKALILSNTLKGHNKTSNVYEIRDILASMGNEMKMSEIMHYIEQLIKVRYVKFFDPEKSENRFYSPTQTGLKAWARHEAGIKEGAST